MKTTEAKKLLKPFMDRCKKDNDRYLLFHISQEQDKFKALAKVSPGDVLVIIHELVEQYGLLPEAVYKSLK